MISSDNRRYAYGKSQLIEVICQLRFPTILSIDTREPADFQETVRAAFPRYQCQVEKLPGVNGAPARTVNNHTFISEDGGYKLSLTKDFIALSTMRYTHWEDLAARLDEPLGQFIKIYRPNCFDRVGLRFVNAISREQLGLTGRRWNDLLQPPYLGILDEDGVAAAAALQTLYRWMRRNMLLQEELNEAGYNKFRHSFLKHEVAIIVRHLGEP